MTNFVSPTGRLVQGSPTMQHLKDMENNNKPLFNDDGSPTMGIFMALAFPKLINGASNAEFDAFFSLLRNEAATAWPSLFPQGAGGNCVNPRFSWKYQDGDGINQNGQSVKAKAGFAGHHIIKFTSKYPVRCYMEGQFSPHQELAKPDDVISRGDWIRIVGDVRGNNAEGTQVPGIVLYPSLVSFIGRDPTGRISSGPEAATAFTGTAYVPPGVTANPAAVGAGAASGVPVPGIAVPGIAVAGVPVPGIAVVSPGIPVPGAAGIPSPTGAVAGIPLPPAKPAYIVSPSLLAQAPTATVEGVLAQGWTLDAAVAQGLLIKQ